MAALGWEAVSHERGTPATLDRWCLLSGKHSGSLCAYRGTLPIRNQPLLGPYRRPVPRVLGES